MSRRTWTRTTVVAFVAFVASAAAACTPDPERDGGRAEPTSEQAGPVAGVAPPPALTADDLSVAPIGIIGAGRAVAVATAPGGTVAILTTSEVRLHRVGTPSPTRLDTTAPRRHPLVAIDDDATLVATVTVDPPAVVWYSTAGGEVARADLPTATPPDWLGFAPGGRLLLVGTDHGPLAWPAPPTDGEPPIGLGAPALTGPPAFLPSGTAVIPLIGTRSVARLADGVMLRLELDLPDTAVVQAVRATPAGEAVIALLTVGDGGFDRPSQIEVLDPWRLRPQRSIRLGRDVGPDAWTVTDSVAAVTSNDRVELFSLTGDGAASIAAGDEQAVGQIARAAGGLVTSRADGGVAFWPTSMIDAAMRDAAATTRPAALRSGGHTLTSTTVSQDGSFLTLVDADGAIEIRSGEHGGVVDAISEFAAGSLTDVAVADDGSLAAGSATGAIVLGHTDLATRPAAVDGPGSLGAPTPPARVDAVAFRPGTTELAAGRAERRSDLSFDDTLTLWDTIRGEMLFRSTGAIEDVPGCAFYFHRLDHTPDGRLLASAAHDRSIAIHDAATGEVVHRIPARSGAIFDLRFTADGRHLIVSADDNAVEVYAVATWALAATIVSPLGGYSAFDVLPGGDAIIAADVSGGLSRVDLEEGRPTPLDALLPPRPTTVEVSPDGALAAAPTADGDVGLWSTVTGERVATLHGHSGDVTGIAFAATGESIVTSGDDGTIRVWSLAVVAP